MAERASIIAIPWYRRRDHTALSKLFSDPENLPKTFEEWLELALLAERRFQRGLGCREDRDLSSTFCCVVQGAELDSGPTDTPNLQQ